VPRSQNGVRLIRDAVLILVIAAVLVAWIIAVALPGLVWLCAKAVYESAREWRLAYPDTNPGLNAQEMTWLRDRHEPPVNKKAGE